MTPRRFPADTDMAQARHFLTRVLGDLGALSDPVFDARFRKLHAALTQHTLDLWEIASAFSRRTPSEKRAVRRRCAAEQDALLGDLWTLAQNATGWLNAQHATSAPDPLSDYIRACLAQCRHHPDIARQYRDALAFWQAFRAAAQPTPPEAAVLKAAGQLTFAGV